MEDDIANQQVALLLLQKIGHPADLATNGQMAVTLSKKREYSLILMDCQMPIMNGFDASLAIRNSVGPNQKTPIIALTANLVSGVDHECFECGMDDVLNKPVLMNDLKIITEKWLGESSNYHSINRQN